MQFKSVFLFLTIFVLLLCVCTNDNGNPSRQIDLPPNVEAEAAGSQDASGTAAVPPDTATNAVHTQETAPPQPNVPAVGEQRDRPQNVPRGAMGPTWNPNHWGANIFGGNFPRHPQGFQGGPGLIPPGGHEPLPTFGGYNAPPVGGGGFGFNPQFAVTAPMASASYYSLGGMDTPGAPAGVATVSTGRGQGSRKRARNGTLLARARQEREGAKPHTEHTPEFIEKALEGYWNLGLYRHDCTSRERKARRSLWFEDVQKILPGREYKNSNYLFKLIREYSTPSGFLLKRRVTRAVDLSPEWRRVYDRVVHEYHARQQERSTNLSRTSILTTSVSGGNGTVTVESGTVLSWNHHKIDSVQLAAKLACLLLNVERGANIQNLAPPVIPDTSAANERTFTQIRNDALSSLHGHFHEEHEQIESVSRRGRRRQPAPVADSARPQTVPTDPLNSEAVINLRTFIEYAMEHPDRYGEDVGESLGRFYGRALAILEPHMIDQMARYLFLFTRNEPTIASIRSVIRILLEYSDNNYQEAVDDCVSVLRDIDLDNIGPSDQPMGPNGGDVPPDQQNAE